MKYPFFASFIVLSFLFSFSLKKRMKKDERTAEDFWEKENLANSTRRKSLESLAYIAVPLNDLPMDVLAQLSQVQEYHAGLRALSEKKIVNFAGFSNTELKLAYGAPNINLLSEYDQNFEALITLLKEWASFLLQNWGEGAQSCPEKERKQAAKTVLAYAVSVGSDIYASYEQLVNLYLECGESDKIPALKQRAEKLRSLSKGRILALLEEAEKREKI